MKKLLFTFFLLTTSAYVWAQESKEDEKDGPKAIPLVGESLRHPYRNDHKKPGTTSMRLPNYGSLIVGGGLNFLRECPPEINSKNWSARFLDISLYYNVRIRNSHFTISPGIGLNFGAYKLQKDHVLVRNQAGTVFKKKADVSNNISSALGMSYLDFCLLEVRFNANSKCPKESFFIALGGKVGMLLRASTKVCYIEHDERKKCSNRETFNLKKVRYGAYVRLGWGRFGLSYTHTLSSLFEEGRGPKNTTTKPCSFGLSVDCF